jgi:hypothetical protein
MKLRETFGIWKLPVRHRLEVVRRDCGDLLRRDRGPYGQKHRQDH